MIPDEAIARLIDDDTTPRRAEPGRDWLSGVFDGTILADFHDPAADIGWPGWARLLFAAALGVVVLAGSVVLRLVQAVTG